MDKYKSIIKISLVVIGLVIIGFSTIDVYQNEGNEYTVCGTVKYKGDRMEVHKYRSDQIRVIAVQFNHGIEDVDVTFSTWSAHNTGDRICFTRHSKASKSSLNILFITGLAIASIIVYYIVSGIFWLFNVTE